MANLLQLHQGTKSYGPRHLFEGASFSINDGEHVGVIGPNGAGKTTLFKILTGQEHLDSGTLTQAKNLRIGYLAQHDNFAPNQTMEEYLAEGTHMPIWDLKSLGKNLGLSDAQYSAPITSLSGGYRMRCKLLHLLGQEPDLILLDEPTNYLDLESLLTLEKFLQNYKHAFLLISHDREFLRRTTDHILEVEAGDITKYNGSLDAYFEQKELLRTQLEACALSVEQKRQEILDFVARFGAKATKASQAQSRLKQLDKLESIEIKALPNTTTINLPEPSATGKVILTATNAALGYGDRTVLRDINFTLARGDHLAVVGVNGAGKSTLLKALAQKLTPLSGTITPGHNVTIGYYAQHVSEALNPNHTVFQAMSAKAHPSVLPQQVLNLAGALLFPGDDVKKPISVLSGGEKSRVALGQILLQKAPCLLLDEPTNHLDFQTVEALTVALKEYPGTVVVVSHDRSFMSRIASKILEIRDGHAQYYPGTYGEYVWSLTHGSMSARERAKENQKSVLRDVGSASAPNPEKKFNFKEEKKALEKELRRVTRQQEELDEKLGWLNGRVEYLNKKLVDEPQSKDAAAWVKELGEIAAQISETEEKWLELGGRREELKKEIEGMLG